MAGLDDNNQNSKSNDIKMVENLKKIEIDTNTNTSSNTGGNTPTPSLETSLENRLPQVETKPTVVKDRGRSIKERLLRFRSKPVVVKGKPEDPKKKKIKKILLFTFLGLLIFFLVIFIPIGILSGPVLTNLKTTYAKAQEVANAAKTQDLVLVNEKIKETRDSFEKSKSAYSRLKFVKIIPILSSYYCDGDHLFQAGESGLNLVAILVEALTPYADVLGFKGEGSFTGGTAEDRIAKIIETLGEVTPKLGEVENEMKNVQKHLGQVNVNRYPKQIRGIKVQENLQKLKDMADTAAVSIVDARPAIEVLPKVLGSSEPQKYLLIMQNDGELRPTGGFMTAYAVIKVESGKVIPEKSDDIYSLDEKSKEKVKAPEPIKKYLFSASLKTGIVPYWYLRDMNLSPDFQVSMETFKEHYDEVPGEPEVDGVIAIDTKVLKDFLTILGPIDLPEYGSFTMEADSRCHDIPQVVCELEYIVDTPIPGIKRGRKDVLGPLMKGILNKIFDSPSGMWPGIFRLGLQEIKEKHILFYFPDEQTQEAAEKLNGAGRIVGFDQDYLHINDTNFGGAKSNLFVSHQVEQKIEVDSDNNIIKTLTLTYTNPEPMDDCNLERPTGLCLNGILRNFLRVYVPKGSELIEARGSEEDVETYEELDKTVFEGFFTLRGDGGRAKVVINYKLPFKYQEGEDYKLLIQKQPGTYSHKYIVEYLDEKQEFELTADKELLF